MLFRMIGFLTMLATLAWGNQTLAAWQDKGDKPQDDAPATARQDEGADSEDADNANAKEDQEPTAQDILKDAMAKAQVGDLDGAIELIEKANALEPEDPLIAVTLIGAVQARALELIDGDKRADANPYFFKAATLARGLNADAAKIIGPHAGSVIFDEARAYAAVGNKEKAIASLDDAFARGFDEFELARSHVDFESIRENSEFVALLERHEKRILEEMLVKTKGELEDFKTFDFDFKLKNIDGKEIKLEDYKGKIVIVDFWGTWCPPCLAEIPHFIKLKESYGEHDLEVVGLAYENADDDEAALKGVKAFSEENKLNYPCAIGDDKTQELVPDFKGFPTTLFIDREGVVRLQLVGFHPHAKLEMVVQQLMGGKDE